MNRLLYIIPVYEKGTNNTNALPYDILSPHVCNKTGIIVVYCTNQDIGYEVYKPYNKIHGLSNNQDDRWVYCPNVNNHFHIGINETNEDLRDMVRNLVEDCIARSFNDNESPDMTVFNTMNKTADYIGIINETN